MKLAHTIAATASAAALVCGTMGHASDDPRIAPGVRILGADGEAVGTVEETRDDAVVVNTGSHRALITIRSIERADDGLRINATRDDIDKMIDQRRRDEAARRDEFLAPGRLVRSVDSQPVGRIVAIEREAESVVILRNEGIIALKTPIISPWSTIDWWRCLRARRSTRIPSPCPRPLRQRLAGMSAR